MMEQRVPRNKSHRRGAHKGPNAKIVSKKRVLEARRIDTGKATAGRSYRRTRLDPNARAAMILDEAVTYFAEHGFNAQVRDLSKRLNVSSGLIYRYFGTKKDLIEKVYERVYVARWSDSWAELLSDRSQPLRMRLITFYRSYLAAVDEFEWIRVSLFFGLTGYDFTHRYVMTRVEKLLKIIMIELQQIEPRSALPSRPEELHEIVWHLHSTFIYYLIRKYVFEVPAIEDRNTFVDTIVGHFLAGLNSDLTQSGTMKK